MRTGRFFTSVLGSDSQRHARGKDPITSASVRISNTSCTSFECSNHDVGLIAEFRLPEIGANGELMGSEGANGVR